MTRVLIHVQHLLGTGHLFRAAALARALGERGLAVTLASGGLPVPGIDPGTAELVQLPPLRSRDARFSTLVDDAGRPIDDAWRERRRAALLDLFARLRPRVVVTEMFPFGRRALRFELLPLLATARVARSRPFMVASARDVLTRRKPGRAEEAADLINRFYDLVLVHGDAAVIPFAASFPAAEAITVRLVHTGYIATPALPVVAGRDEVLISAGGGAVGARLLRTALAARALSLRAGERRWRLLVGRNLGDDDFAALAAAAPAGVVVELTRADFRAMLANCAVSVSQAGYNTVVDVVAARARAVVVPFARETETEQRTRAERFAARGLLAMLDEGALTPETLAAAIDAAIMRPRPPPRAVDLDGAARSAALIAARAEGSVGKGCR